MKVHDIYDIAKKAQSKDFYNLVVGDNTTFIYLHDIRISLGCIVTNRIYGYDYFYNADGNEVMLTNPYDNLIKSLCKIKDYQETYNNITSEVWALKLNGQPVYTFNAIRILNYSTLGIHLPTTLTTFDFEMNLCDILNGKLRGSSDHGEQLVKEAVSQEESILADFINQGGL